MKSIKKIMMFINTTIERSFSTSAHQLVPVGAITFFGFTLFYWLWAIGFPQPFENLWLRLLGSFLGLGLMLTPHWPGWSKPFLPWYWFITILYAWSFFFAYSFLMNQASVISAMSLLCSVFLLVLLVDLLSLSLMLVLGWSLAFLCYYLTAQHIYFADEHIEMGLVILFVVIAGSTVNYKMALLQQQRLAGVAAAAGMIAHELRTPLLGIKSGAQALSTYSPTLFAAYKTAKEHGLLTSSIRESRLKQLEGISERIISETDYANIIIDMLLIKAGRENSLLNCILEPCSMAECLSEAIARYPFQSPSARALVNWQGDFQFIGSKLLMQHVLFNLLKNALYVIATEQRGDIKIWTEKGEKYNYLHVKDTAKGMSGMQLSRLFEHFYTTKFMGTGIGLSFCKLVMKRFEGDIQCEAEEGVYTKFTLSFPYV
jgi:signal transduction histidine kinase